MIIEKFFLRLKIFTLLFSFSFGIFIPAFGRLKSAGQLSLSVNNLQEKPVLKDSINLGGTNDDQEVSFLLDKLKTSVDVAVPENKQDSLDAAKVDAAAKNGSQPEEKIIFNFEDVDLANVAAYIEKLFDVKFITDESINPLTKGGKALSGNKISFKTQKPLSRDQAWGLFIAFLNMAGLALVPQADPKFYRITLTNQAKKSAIPVYIGVDTNRLPDNDSLIRYGYFVKDCPLETIKNVLESLRSTASDLLILNDHNAFIITDNSYNIKVLMKIVKELDKVTMPQSMSVLHLYKVDAEHAKKIYNDLTKDDQSGTVAARLFGPRRPSRALYFPKDAKMIVEPRTNSLILLGTAEGIKIIENFIKDYVDVDVNAPYSPLYIYDLKYANAIDIANIMNSLVKFGTEKTRGGVRGGDKFFKNMNFTAEKEGNRLIIRGDYDDYLKAKEIIDQIDEPPVQVAIEILILSIDIQDQRELGTQIRNKFLSPDGTRLNFQTSGITLGSSAKGIIQNTDETASGNLRLLGDLINLVTGATAGNTVVSLGSDRFGVWGIFGVLNQLTNTQLVSNPFLTATNNTKARVKLGETIRIVTADVIGQTTEQAFDDYDANIDVEVTPKINSDGMIVMSLKIVFDSFLSNASKTTRKIETSVVTANNEILALGGLLKDRNQDAMSRTPILGKIPILGWLFKNKKKVKKKEDLLVLITAHIIDPAQEIKEFTKRHVKDYKDTLKEVDTIKTLKDPIDRSFFKDKKTEFNLDNFIFTREKENNFFQNKEDKDSNKISKKTKKGRKKNRKKKTKNKKKKSNRRRRNKKQQSTAVVA